MDNESGKTYEEYYNENVANNQRQELDNHYNRSLDEMVESPNKSTTSPLMDNTIDNIFDMSKGGLEIYKDLLYGDEKNEIGENEINDYIKQKFSDSDINTTYNGHDEERGYNFDFDSYDGQSSGNKYIKANTIEELQNELDKYDVHSPDDFDLLFEDYENNSPYDKRLEDEYKKIESLGVNPDLISEEQLELDLPERQQDIFYNYVDRSVNGDKESIYNNLSQYMSDDYIKDTMRYLDIDSNENDFINAGINPSSPRKYNDLLDYYVDNDLVDIDMVIDELASGYSEDDIKRFNEIYELDDMRW